MKALKSFSRRIKKDFIHVSFRQLGISTLEMTDLLSVTKAVKPVGSAYPQASFPVGTDAEYMSVLERIRLGRIKILHFKRTGIEHIHPSSIRADIVFPRKITA